MPTFASRSLMTFLLGFAAVGGALAQTTPADAINVGVQGVVGIGIDPDNPGNGLTFSKVAVSGAKQSAQGPHAQFMNDGDKYPLLQILPWRHDNIALSFDAYFDGTNWRTSDGGTSGTSAGYAIYKLSGTLNFNYTAPSTAQGALTTWKTAMNIDSNGCVRVAGAPVGGACSSDERLKANVQTVPSSVDAVSRLRMVSFDYRRDQFPGLPEGRQTGVIAQELQQVMPELVKTDANGLLSVDYGGLNQRLQAAVIEMARASMAQQQQIAALRDELASLREQLGRQHGASR